MIKDKIRAVFYARVSTDEEMQVNALAKQIQENKDVIQTKGWELVDQYIDEGKSGTQIKTRDEYKRLLEDLETDKFDIIVIKSQDRLMRNVKDWYIFVDKLVSNSKRLYMYLDNSFYTTDNTLITGIKAILAEEYSRDLSKKLNNSNRRRVEKAKAGENVSAMGTNMAYGHHIQDGKWVIDPEQAEVVKKVYELYLQYDSIRKVCHELNEQGYKNQKGKPFLEDSVRRILRNERNKGVNVLNRYHRDFDTKKIIKNPKDEWVYIKGACDPIIDEITWKKVNDRLDSKVDPSTLKGKKVGSDPLSSKLYCANCGKVMWKHKSNGYTNWYCSGNYGKGAVSCDNPSTTTTVSIRKVLKEITKDLVVNKAEVKKSILNWLYQLEKSLDKTIDREGIVKELNSLEKKKDKLTEAYLEEIISKEDYKAKYLDLESRIDILNKQLTPIEENEDLKEVRAVINNIDDEIECYINTTNFEDSKVDFLVDHIKKLTVCGKMDFVIELDLLAGVILTGKDFLLYVNESMP